jgi:alanine racemase
VQDFYRPTWIEVSLDALESNWNELRKFLPDDMHMMAVVKADAYGHGAVQVAEQVIEQGADYIGVAFLDEALDLRKDGITAPILVLGYTAPESIQVAIEHDITLTAFSHDLLSALQNQALAEDDKQLKVHVKIDSGMGRVGLHQKEDAIAYIEEMMKLPNVLLEGVFTHYATADEADKTYITKQYHKFEEIISHFKKQGIEFPYIHAGNSATAIDTPELSYNMVRIGIAMYGMYPSGEVKMDEVHLKPVLSIKSKIVMLKTLPPNSGISYGIRYHTKGDERIATLPIGYADGYSRLLNGKGEALVHGKRVPIVGTICMDQCMIQVDNVKDAQVGDEVVLLGTQGTDSITAEEIADKLGTINYEIVCMLSHRVPRVYVKKHKVVKVVNALWKG